MRTTQPVFAILFAFLAMLTMSCLQKETNDVANSSPVTDTDPADNKSSNQQPSEEQMREQAQQEHAQSQEPRIEPRQPPRIVSINGGSHKLNIEQWPLIGPADATYVMVTMYDYACPHCRTTDKAIREACEALGNDVAIIAMPVPLNANCNETVKRTGKGFEESCEIARLAVACWRVSPESFQEFHENLFSGDEPPTYAAARQIVDELVGKEKIEAELAQPFADKYIRKHVDLYARSGAGPLPRLMFKTANVVGEVSSTDAMTEIIKTKAKQ